MSVIAGHQTSPSVVAGNSAGVSAPAPPPAPEAARKKRKALPPPKKVDSTDDADDDADEAASARNKKRRVGNADFQANALKDIAELEGAVKKLQTSVVKDLTKLSHLAASLAAQVRGMDN